ncbi:MAG: prolyl oligopeptidase family serine peptidase, partial [Bacteroidota bacterium]
LVMSVSPNDILDAPMQYFSNSKCRGNQWIDYQLVITDSSSQRIWNKEKRRILPLVDQFDLDAKFKYNDQLTMSYASYKPNTENKKIPLIIWLHGGGEGGYDPTIPLLANRAANYASEEIQTYFDGAYVLVPQCPGAWMHNEKGVSTWGEENDVYNQGLMALIKDFVKQHPDVDEDRIYVGGCSNGGYMSVKLLILFPEYFAAAFPSALAYKSEYITDAQIESIKDIPMWFIHAKDDPVTRRDETVLPVYQRLMKAGAKNVYFSDYDHVVDITGFYGGRDYHYLGHFSWIYSHANTARLDFDGKPVMVDGRPVTIMEWLAMQKKK